MINNYSFFDDENNYLADDDYIFKAGTYVVEIGLWPEDGFAFPSNGGMADGTKIAMTINGESPYDWYGGDSGIPVLFLRAQFTLSDPTGCANVPNNDVQCTKVIRDGQLYLMYKGQMYNVQGQEVK